MERSILQFLRRDKSHAFSASEIIDALYNMRLNSLLDVGKFVLVSMAVDNDLKRLVKDGSVNVKQIDYQPYYMAA